MITKTVILDVWGYLRLSENLRLICSSYTYENMTFLKLRSLAIVDENDRPKEWDWNDGRTKVSLLVSLVQNVSWLWNGGLRPSTTSS